MDFFPYAKGRTVIFKHRNASLDFAIKKTSCCTSAKTSFENRLTGIPGWHSGLVPAFGPGRDPGDPGSSPMSGSWCMEPAFPSAYVSAFLSLSDYHK